MDNHIYVVENQRSYISFTKYRVVKEMANSFSVDTPERVLPRVSHEFYRRINKGAGVCYNLHDAIEYYVSLVYRKIESLQAEIAENELRIAVARQMQGGNDNTY